MGRALQAAPPRLPRQRAPPRLRRRPTLVHARPPRRPRRPRRRAGRPTLRRAPSECAPAAARRRRRRRSRPPAALTRCRACAGPARRRPAGAWRAVREPRWARRAWPRCGATGVRAMAPGQLWYGQAAHPDARQEGNCLPLWMHYVSHMQTCAPDQTACTLMPSMVEDHQIEARRTLRLRPCPGVRLPGAT